MNHILPDNGYNPFQPRPNLPPFWPSPGTVPAPYVPPLPYPGIPSVPNVNVERDLRRLIDTLSEENARLRREIAQMRARPRPEIDLSFPKDW